MKKLSTKGILRFAGAMAACAFVLPSVALASSWGPIGGPDHVLDSPNIGFVGVFSGEGVTSRCTSSSFTATVRSAADMQITAGSFNGCTWSGASVGNCTMTWTPTGFPWTATAVTTSNLQIHNIDIDVTFENAPGTGASCFGFFPGAKATFTGTLTGGNWTGGGQHSLDFNSSTGLLWHWAVGNNIPFTLTASLSDTRQTLTVT